MGHVVIQSIQELQALKPTIHWFCPREGDEADFYFDEDINVLRQSDTGSPDEAGARKERIDRSAKIRLLALEALQVLAFDDAASLQGWLADTLRKQLTSCDVCVRVYHQSKKDLRQTLLGYDEDDVAAFMRNLDSLDTSRIKDGLEVALKNLEVAPAGKSKLSCLSAIGLFAVFEALCCEAFLNDDLLVTQQLNRPFRLMQSAKFLTLHNVTPAMTRFLFSPDAYYRSWAYNSWKKWKRNILASEFELAVKDQFFQAMAKAQMVALDSTHTSYFWQGAKHIVSKLDKQLIAHSLRALDIDISKLALEHLQFDFDSFDQLIVTMTTLITVAPSEFWDAMGAISPVTVIEQMITSPSMERLLRGHDVEKNVLTNLFTVLRAWLVAFLASLKPTNMAPVLRCLIGHLLERLQDPAYPTVVREQLEELGVAATFWVLRSLKLDPLEAGLGDTVGAAIVMDVLDVVSRHLKAILRPVQGLPLHEYVGSNADRLEIACISLHLDSVSLVKEHEALSKNRHHEDRTSHYSENIWSPIIHALTPKSVALAEKALLGIRTLAGVNEVEAAHDAPMRDVVRFNSNLSKFSKASREILDRISDYDITDINILFESPLSSGAILTPLLFSDDRCHEAAVELLKLTSLQPTRQEGLEHFIIKSYSKTLNGLSTAIRSAVRLESFTICSRILRLCSNVIDTLCDPHRGLLRSKTLSAIEATETERIWAASWGGLNVIFRCTESWCTLSYQKSDLADFCRDTMQFANRLFDENTLFNSALSSSLPDTQGVGPTSLLTKRLLDHPKLSMDVMVKWLRLRDEYLYTISVELISKLLIRLRKLSISVSAKTTDYLKSLIKGKIRSKLSHQQLAELEHALLDSDSPSPSTSRPTSPKSTKQQRLPFTEADGLKAADQTTRTSTGNKRLGGNSKWNAEHDDDMRKLVAESSKNARIFKDRKATLPLLSKPIARRDTAAVAGFVQQRAREKEEKRRRDAAVIEAQRKRLVGENADGAKGPSIMVSSDGDSENERAALDRELFGSDFDEPEDAVSSRYSKPAQLSAVPQLPFKKRKLTRSVRDIRARLVPDLAKFHSQMLGWDYFFESDYPPNMTEESCAAVQRSFDTTEAYQQVFKPLVMLEAWQGLLKAKDEPPSAILELKVANRSTVDSFVEINTVMPYEDKKRPSPFMEGDLCLLGTNKGLMTAPDARHTLARVWRVVRKKAHFEILLRATSRNMMMSILNPQTIITAAKIQSLIPLEREFGALHALQYYDLSTEIIEARPSPLLSYSDAALAPIMATYKLNKAQSKALKSSLDNDAFTLIQGPPGSGKTKTIIAMVGALLTNPTPGSSKKLLVCAPSNAAVDELVSRLKVGVLSLHGHHKAISVVRLGHVDAINSKVLDVSLDMLIKARLGPDPSAPGREQRNSTQIAMKEHQAVSVQVREIRTRLSEATSEESIILKPQFDELKRKQIALSSQIDLAKDNETTLSRREELNRKKAQSDILNGADVICATLSGSGHEMFQSLSIEFETVVVDEAAQCVEVSALIPLKYGCSKCILVGDPKQLPPTILSREAAKFQYEQSLFVRMQENHPDYVHLLDTQYRMHPDISAFPSKVFYDGKLLDGPNVALSCQRPWHANSQLGPYRFFDVEGAHQTDARTHSLINHAEIKVALCLFDRLTTDYRSYDFKGKIDIITPYKSQVRALKDQFSRRYGAQVFEKVAFSTTDAFQGRENEVIIFSCVRGSPTGGIGFLNDVRRMNVGLTRAKNSLWVVGNSRSLARGRFWCQLVEDARSRGFYTDGDIGHKVASCSVPVKPEPLQVLAPTTAETSDLLNASIAANGAPVMAALDGNLSKVPAVVAHKAVELVVAKPQDARMLDNNEAQESDDPPAPSIPSSKERNQASSGPIDQQLAHTQVHQPHPLPKIPPRRKRPANPLIQPNRTRKPKTG